MDAKPQRPAKLQIRNQNENAPPANLNGAKTLHQRNKSTPALSALLSGGVGTMASKFTNKRTAFGDVSNTFRPLQPIKDANNKTIDVKPNVLPNEPTKTAALLKPAQRPLSAAVSKPILSSTAHSLNGLLDKRLQKPVIEEAAKPVVKRQTTVFKEVNDVALVTSVTTQEPAKLSSIDATSNLDYPIQEKSTTCEGMAKPVTDQLPLVQNLAIDPLLTSIAPNPPHRIENVQSIPAVPEPTQSHPLKEIDNLAGHEASYLNDISYLKALIEPDLSEPIADASMPKADVPPVRDVEEYWDAEEEEEFYEAEGYTTRSLRSRAENTTGAVTVNLTPGRKTAKIRTELDRAGLWVEQNRPIEEIEDEDWDPSMVAQYADEIFEYMEELENRLRPDGHYMESQTEVQWGMRALLVEWLVQVHDRFSMCPETLFLTMNIIDRFLTVKVVSVGKLQLVGATAILIASKYEEVNPPTVSDIIFMVDNTYTADEVLKAERFMLNMLQYELGWPGPMSFLRRISKADDYDLDTRTLAKYLMELTLMDERFVGCVPSFLAAGAQCLARFLLAKGDWSLTHVHYSQYTYAQLRPLCMTILEGLEDPKTHHLAIYTKYSDRKFKTCAMYVQEQLQQGFNLPSLPRESGTSFSMCSRRS
ncbi:hypothetical protein P152DRAFT_227101 [Eremomyces bilateralis CBS 781.70]|uniref:Cyclin N-terminal domain-containing protein n=1 Tax=Eremomyces bilateralis CBS 781.70 TaxID=1392243 RepID=A0A6G1FRM9_9PEZI|nr:uncharacterized protein P152DRAFT_227101 [Eremomyces bilateralis CBS 781.70]KAF1808322.1 hypothetical protein P152DRAFT_227101 [Eremomyces bilateralis CBS 781.70]